jgi:hypothetical protein
MGDSRPTGSSITTNFFCAAAEELGGRTSATWLHDPPGTNDQRATQRDQRRICEAGQTDWAVLCSIAGVSTILVFWNASEIKPTEIAMGNDMDRLQSWSENKMVYSREIEAVGKSYIMEHYKACGGPKPSAIDHQGINDVFVGKASVVLYFYRGKWLQLSGAD